MSAPLVSMDHIQTGILFLLLIMFLGPPSFVFWLYLKNRGQKQHSLLRGKYWFLGILRYMIESVGPEFRFYITDDDNNGKPLSRVKFVSIVKAAKYLKTLISYGSKRDFSLPGVYMKNSMFPKLETELAVDNSPLQMTHRYITKKETLFFRYERVEKIEVRPWYLTPENTICVGKNRKHPWAVKGVIGMSGMSYGALGKNAITSLSKGIGMAGGSWMNTGEGGVSQYHLSGGCDLIYQIGPGLFGVRTETGEMDWAKLREKGAIPQVKAFELKMGQGAKIRGGHVEGAKVTREIAGIRGVEPFRNIDSPNRFTFITSTAELFDFVEKIQQETGKPVGLKVVIGDADSLDGFCEEFIKRGSGPDFITIDGSEGGTGATYKEMADMLGLPLYPALVAADRKLRQVGLRDKVKIFASGKLHLPEEIALALALGADCINIARGFMIATGCIMALKCHSNECPVGVATTDPILERALYVDEKKFRVMNYIITLRAGLYHLAAACGIESPTQFDKSHLVYKQDEYNIINIARMFDETA